MKRSTLLQGIAVLGLATIGVAGCGDNLPGGGGGPGDPDGGTVGNDVPPAPIDVPPPNTNPNPPPNPPPTVTPLPGTLGAWAPTPSGTTEDLLSVWGPLGPCAATDGGTPPPVDAGHSEEGEDAGRPTDTGQPGPSDAGPATCTPAAQANNILANTDRALLKYSGTAWGMGPGAPDLPEGPGHRGGAPALRAVGGFDTSTSFVTGVTIPAEGSAESGRGLIGRITTGGTTATMPMPQAYLNGVWGRAADDIWAVGGDFALHWDGRAWMTRAEGIPRNSDLQGVWGSSATDVWAVGAGVYRLTGSTWARVDVPGAGSANFLGVWGSGANDVWVVGNSAAQHWDGHGWRRFFVGTTDILRGIWGAAPNDVWAVGDNGRVAHWNGASWFTVPSTITTTLSSVWGVGAGNVWAVGARGTILHYTGQAGNGGGPRNSDIGPSTVTANAGLRVTAAGVSACARKADGSVKCWGDNRSRQLGDGTTVTRYEPVPVMGVAGAVDVAVGSFHSCAVLESGQVMCWGANRNGQLGNGTEVDSPTPVMVANIDNAVQVAVGQAHTCALLRTGNVQCWGLNMQGQVGDGQMTNRSFAATVNAPSDIVAIALGINHSCALRANGGVVCWGAGALGQIGNGGTSSASMGQPVNGIVDAVAIGAGRDHTCVARANGRVMCWGNNAGGQLGNGMATGTATAPEEVRGIFDAVAVGGGNVHSCAVRRGGGVMCWGTNTNGQLGMGTTPTTGAVLVPNISDARGVAAGQDFTCIARGNGQATCWGSNMNGQLGRGMTMGAAQLPGPVPAL